MQESKNACAVEAKDSCLKVRVPEPLPNFSHLNNFKIHMPLSIVGLEVLGYLRGSER